MTDNTYQSTLEISNTPKIEKLINEDRLDEALSLISDETCDDLNLMGIIFTRQSKFDEAIRCFDKALAIEDSDEIKLNKTNALYKYAKISFFPDGDYEKALNLINTALDMTDENEDEFYFLKAEILESIGDLKNSHKYYLMAHGEFERLKEFERQTEYLENTDDILINITGNYFYDFTPSEGLIVDLKIESDNEHDPDAIAVFLDGEKIGYVANSDYTVMDGASGASDIKNKINNNSKSEILFVYLDKVVGKVII